MCLVTSHCCPQLCLSLAILRKVAVFKSETKKAHLNYYFPLVRVCVSEAAEEGSAVKELCM